MKKLKIKKFLTSNDSGIKFIKLSTSANDWLKTSTPPMFTVSLFQMPETKPPPIYWAPNILLYFTI